MRLPSSHIGCNVIWSDEQPICKYIFRGLYSKLLSQHSPSHRQRGVRLSLARVHNYRQRVWEAFITHNFHKFINSCVACNVVPALKVTLQQTICEYEQKD
jgi:hypothetical protein